MTTRPVVLLEAVRRIPLHRFGWGVLAAALLACAVGWPTRWFELRLAGVFALSLVVLALCFTLGRPRFEVELGLTDDRVQVGEPASGRLRVTNRGRHRSLPSRLDLPIGALTASFSLPSLAVGAVHEDEFAIPTQRRAVVEVGPAQSVQGDPFGLSGLVRHWTGRRELYVHPRTVPLPGREAGFVHDLEGRASQVLSSSDMDFHALREYVPGDDRRQVHWRSSARAGQLLVRQFSETRQSRVALLLDTNTASHLGEDDFELAVAAAGSIGLQALREDHPLVVLQGDRVLPTPHPRRLLDELSGVEVTEFAPQALVREAVRRAPGSSLVVLVSGAGVTLAQLTRLLSAVPHEVRVLAVQCDPASSTRVQTIGRTSLVRIPALDELPRAMRRAMA